MALIILSGNIGTGKTSVLNLIEGTPGVEINKETPEDNNYFAAYNKKPELYWMQCQATFLFHFSSNEIIRNEIFNNSIRLNERSSSENCYVFVRSLLEQKIINADEFKNYKNILQCVSKNCEIAKKIIFLDLEPSKCMERIKGRSRKNEIVTLDYLRMLSKLYEMWLDRMLVNGTQVVRINSDRDREAVSRDVALHLKNELVV